MTTQSDHPSVMVNIRRVGISLLAGFLLLTGAMVQASAVEADTDALAATERGLALGLTAGAELESQVAEGVVRGEGVARSLEVLDAIVDRFNENEERNGRGPLRAIEVHEALLAGQNPSTITKEGPMGNAFGWYRKVLEDGERPGNRPDVPPGQAKKDADGD